MMNGTMRWLTRQKPLAFLGRSGQALAWTQEHLWDLRYTLANGGSMEDAAQILGRPLDEIRAKAASMGIVERLRRLS